MRKVRNVVIIIILCIISSLVMKRKPLNLFMMPSSALKDSVAGPAHLVMPPVEDVTLQTIQHESPATVVPHGASDNQSPPPPRGGGEDFRMSIERSPVLSPSSPAE